MIATWHEILIYSHGLLIQDKYCCTFGRGADTFLMEYMAKSSQRIRVGVFCYF